MDTKKIALLEQGAFPKHFDPWLEKGHYFQQLHGHMITNLYNSLRLVLLEKGYRIAREASLQIGLLQPDLSIQKRDTRPVLARDYETAVLELSLDAGLALHNVEESELHRISITSLESKRLVTVIELISPTNKQDDEKMIRYQNRRNELLEQAVDVVEIDLSRSFKRLIDDLIVKSYPYHIAIHLFDRSSRFIGMRLEEALKSFGLPVEEKVFPVELNSLYRQSYSELLIANQMLDEGHYTAENLPFPTTLSDAEREQLMLAVKTWQEALK